MSVGESHHIEEIVSGKKEQRRVASDPDYMKDHPEQRYLDKSYIEVPAGVLTEDSFLFACATEKGLYSQPQVSSWFCDELKGLISLNKTLGKEMSLSFIASPEGSLYMSEEIESGWDNGVLRATLFPERDMPKVYREAGYIHSHILSSLGMSAFSNDGTFEADWGQIIDEGDNFLDVVVTAEDIAYVAYRFRGRFLQSAKEYFKEHDPDKLLWDNYLLMKSYKNIIWGTAGLAGQPEMLTTPDKSNSVRIEINKKLAKMFGFSLYEIDINSRKVTQLV